MQYPILKLQPKREKSIVNKHPWIFSGAIQGKVNAQDGEIVEVRSGENKVLGYGFFSASSQIACRLFYWGEAPSGFDTVDFWKQKLQRALKLRQVFVPSNTTCYRLIHAEGDFFPGVIIDIYNDVAVLQILIPGVEPIKQLLIKALNELGFNNLFCKAKSGSSVPAVEAHGYWLSGSAAGDVEVLENDLLFKINYQTGQKTGFFIDQRENRLEVKKNAEGKTVLNAFSYTGGFSVYALAGGAKEVHSVDISEEAVVQAQHNAQLNGFGFHHKAITKDCFVFLKDMPADLYDLIVLDPPAFAKHSRAVENAAKGYKQINLRAIQKIKSGGLIFTFSCSQHISHDLFQKIIFGAAVDAQREVRIIKSLHQAPDHPVSIFHPEGAYLKGFLLLVE